MKKNIHTHTHKRKHVNTIDVAVSDFATKTEEQPTTSLARIQTKRGKKVERYTRAGVISLIPLLFTPFILHRLG